MSTHLSELPAYAIVIKDHPASEFYFSKIKPLWESIGVNLQRFDAITPITLPDGPLKFGKSMLSKYTKVAAGGKSFTPTEKAVWYSHFLLWKMCAKMEEPILIIEHDCVPFDNSKLFFPHNTDFHRFDMGALGCCAVDPTFARHATNWLEQITITSGPLGTLCQFWDEEKKKGNLWHVVDPATDATFYDAGCTQIIDSRFNTTIQHTEGTEVEGLVKRPWPYYVVLDEVNEELTIDVIKKHRKQFKNGNF